VDFSGISLQHVIIVDNASTDDSLDGLTAFDLPFIFIKNKKNLGFAAACNQGAKKSTSDYLLFLNPDTCLYKDSLAKPLSFMERPDKSDVGICGIQLVDDSGSVARSCTLFPSPYMFGIKMLGLDKLTSGRLKSHFMMEWDHSDTRIVDHVIGAFYLIRYSLFQELNGFDERFFVYLEDLDLSFRAHQHGWKSFFLADVKAYHKGGGTSEQVKARRLFYSLRSRILYGYKHFDVFSATALMAGTFFLEPLCRLVLAIMRRSTSDMRETLKSFGMLWRSILGRSM
jgi:GT2 family glycosyltransferase